MRRHLKTVVGVGLSVLLLAWALRDVSLAEVWREIRQADPLLFALSILLTLGGFAFRAWRWGVLLLPVTGRLPFRPRFASTIIGFAVNNLLPARVGEFARAFSLSRIAPVRMGAAVATLVVERLFDGMVLIGLLFLSMATAAFPVAQGGGALNPRSAALVIALVMLAAGVVLFAAVTAPRPALRAVEWLAARLLPGRLRAGVVAAIESFLRGLLVLRSGRLFLLSAALTLAQWLFTALSFLLAFRAFGIHEVPFAGAVFLQSLISLAVAIPSSPGFFGPFEAAAKLGLGLWGVSAEKSVSFAVGYHIGGFIPVTLMGIYYMWRLNLRWSDVQDADAPAAEPEPGPPPSRPLLRQGT